jgi:hypothetical protein
MTTFTPINVAPSVPTADITAAEPTQTPESPA